MASKAQRPKEDSRKSEADESRSRGGRPHRDPHGQPTVTRGIRLTIAEVEAVDEVCGPDFSKWVRDLIKRGVEEERAKRRRK